MTSKYKPCRIVMVVLLLISLAGFPIASSCANDDSKYLAAVREFADNVLKYGRDTYGPKHTPLFVDGLNIHTHEPVKWIAPNGDRWILSNLASQQNLFRTLDGLTKITGDPKYRQAAMDAIKYAFENLRSPNGLLYWGGHSAYDAGADRPCGRGIHELKDIYPCYQLMWEVDPNATKQFIEAFWSGHILDWSNLDMNRHSWMDTPLKKPWNYEYICGPVFSQGDGSSFFCTGSSLCCAAAHLTKLSGETRPLVWSKRLAHRYVETRDASTSIAAYVYTGKRTSMPTLQEIKDEGMPAFGFDSCFPCKPTYGNSDERRRWYGYCTVSPGIPFNIAESPWICALMVGEMVGSDGKEFIQWSVEELTAWGRVAYRKSGNSWIPMLRNGTHLEGMVIKTAGPFGPEGTVVEPIPVVPMDFWAYALAYRLTRDDFMWEMARNIALGSGFGDIGATSADLPELNRRIDCTDPYAIMGFIELYKRTQCRSFLESAKQISDNIVAQRFFRGFFVPSSKHIYAKFDSPESLALLQLHAESISARTKVPTVWPSRAFFEEAYRHKDPWDDISLIYSLTESSEVPLSLQEAAAIGDVNLVSYLLEKGTKVDGREDSFKKTALHRAAISGHKDIAGLLLASGANPDARDNYAASSLHYAAQGGHKDIVELLITKGADINAKNNQGRTPLNIAMRRKHKDIVELLRKHGAKE